MRRTACYLLAMVGLVGTARAQSWQHLEFEPVGAARSSAEPVTELHDLVRESDRWNLPDQVHVSDEVREERRALEIPLSSPDQAVTVFRTGDFDPQETRLVRLSLTAAGHSRVRARLERDDGTALVSEWAAIRPSAQRQVVHATFAATADGGNFQRLALVFEGAGSLVRVREVTRLAVSVDRALEDLFDASSLVVLGAESRRGLFVSDRRPIQVTVRPAADTQLRFTLCQPGSVAALGVPSRVEVGVRPLESTDAKVEWVRVAGTRTTGEATPWTPIAVSLERWSGRPVQLTVRVVLEADRGTAGWVVADAALVMDSGEAPLVLLVTTDTHRADHLGLLTLDAFLQTPTLDALAARGLLFEDCLAPINRTNPSHASLLTGTHPRDTSLLANRQKLGPDWTTLAERFRAAGYRTLAAVSVNHLGHARSGLGQGFDRMSWPVVGKRDAEDTVQVLEGWLAEFPDAPLFVWLHLFDAHRPYRPPAPFDGHYYPADKDPKDPGLPDPGLPDHILVNELEQIRDLEYVRAQYRAEITYLDQQLERVLSHERVQQGVVALVGDHGEALGDNQIYFAHNELYPAVTHIPLILAGPGVVPGTRTRAAVTHLDVGRTLLDLAGHKAVEFPGANLVDRSGTAPEGPQRRYLLADRGHSAAVQQDDWFLVMHLTECVPAFSNRHFQKHQVELYDRGTDPGCQQDLVDQHPREARFLRKLLLDWLGQARAAGQNESVTDAEYLEQLRQLGYVDGGEGGLSFEGDGCEWCGRFEGG